MALSDLYNDFQSGYNSELDSAFKQWQLNPENADVVSGTERGGRQTWEELFLHDRNAGPGSVDKNLYEQKFLVDKGYIPIGKGMDYAAKEAGTDMFSFLNSRFPGGQFVRDDVGGSGFGAQGFWKMPGSVNWDSYSAIQQGPEGSIMGAVKDFMSNGGALLLGMLGGGVMANGGFMNAATSGASSAASTAANPFTPESFSSMVSTPPGGGMDWLTSGIEGFTQAPSQVFDWAGGGGLIDATSPAMSFFGEAGNPGMNNWITGTSGSSGWGTGINTSLFGQQQVTDLIKKLIAPPGAPSSGGQGQGQQPQNNATGQNLLSALMNYFQQDAKQEDLLKIAQQASDMANPLKQTERLPYQAQLMQLLSNPSAFFSTNPMVQAQMNMARNAFEAASSKHGVGGTQYGDFLTHMQNNTADEYNKQAQLLAMLGGFNQGPGNAGNIFASMADKAATAGSDRWIGAGALAGQPIVSDLINRGVTAILDTVDTWFAP
jgi:hypothetical protein